MPPIPSAWQWHSLLVRHIKSIRAAAERIAKSLDKQLGSTTAAPEARLEHVLVRNTPKQPLHPLARIRQSQSRWFSTARDVSSRTFTTSAKHRSSVRIDRSSLPKSRIGTVISQSSGRAPFASTLRPNLTGGTLGRTAGGYTLGSGRIGGARHFSHTPATQAQVVQNVSQAMRAFFTQGHKAQYDGVSPRGEKRFKTVTTLQSETGHKLRSLPHATPGSRLEFPINPTITALTPLTGLTGYTASEELQADHLNTSGLLDVLSVDFSRALKDLAAVLNDLKRLSALGDLPITYENSSITVHFPGCDADTVDRLCSELNVTRGSIVQDPEFDAFAGTEIALLFPFAPSKEVSEEDCLSLFEEAEAGYWMNNKKPPFPAAPRLGYGRDILFTPSQHTVSVPAYSTQSDSGLEDILLEENPWQQQNPSDDFVSVRRGSQSYGYSSEEAPSRHDPLEYQGFEGIYRFIEELDSVRR